MERFRGGKMKLKHLINQLSHTWILVTTVLLCAQAHGLGQGQCKKSVAPSAPASLSASNVASQSVTIAWTAASGSAIQSYIVKRNGVQVAEVLTGNSLQHSSLNLQASTSYSFSVAAKNACGQIGAARSLSATTLAIATVPPTTPPPPTAPPTTPPPIEGSIDGSLEVYAGCELPSLVFSRILYIDPVNGLDTNDGLAENRAFKTLAGSIKKIMPGDQIHLLPGTHPAATISQYSAAHLVNSQKWIGIKASRDAKIVGLNLGSMSRWILSGLVFEKSVAGEALSVSDSQQIIVADSTITGGASAAWTVQQWMDAASGVSTRNGFCVTLLRNKILNVRFGIVVSADAMLPSQNMSNTLVKSNLVQNVSGDHIRYLASNVIITGNKFLDTYVSDADGDLNHDDAGQGFALPAYNPADPTAAYKIYENIVFENNFYQDLTRERPLKESAQGFNIFDGLYRKTVWRNNVVLTCHYHGISLYGVEDALIEGNKVISTCKSGSPMYGKLWISAPDSKQGVAAKNVIIRNNYMSKLGGVSAGALLQNNIIVTNPAATFKVFDTTNYIYDLTLN